MIIKEKTKMNIKILIISNAGMDVRKWACSHTDTEYWTALTSLGSNSAKIIWSNVSNLKNYIGYIKN